MEKYLSKKQIRDSLSENSRTSLSARIRAEVPTYQKETKKEKRPVKFLPFIKRTVVVEEQKQVGTHFEDKSVNLMSYKAGTDSQIDDYLKKHPYDYLAVLGAGNFSVRQNNNEKEIENSSVPRGLYLACRYSAKKEYMSDERKATIDIITEDGVVVASIPHCLHLVELKKNAISQTNPGEPFYAYDRRFDTHFGEHTSVFTIQPYVDAIQDYLTKNPDTIDHISFEHPYIHAAVETIVKSAKSEPKTVAKILKQEPEFFKDLPSVWFTEKNRDKGGPCEMFILTIKESLKDEAISTASENKVDQKYISYFKKIDKIMNTKIQKESSKIGEVEKTLEGGK